MSSCDASWRRFRRAQCAVAGCGCRLACDWGTACRLRRTRMMYLLSHRVFCMLQCTGNHKVARTAHESHEWGVLQSEGKVLGSELISWTRLVEIKTC